MSDPSILLLLTCVACTDGADSLTNPSKIANSTDCSTAPRRFTAQSTDHGQSDRQATNRVLGCTRSVSSPETIPVYLDKSFKTHSPSATDSNAAGFTAITPQPAPPESFTQPLTAVDPNQINSSQVGSSADLNRDSSVGTVLLRAGSRGAAVSTLQERLQQLGYDPGAIDGIYGQLTAAAVSSFQQAEGLTVDGVAGPLTRSRLEALLEPDILFSETPEAEAESEEIESVDSVAAPRTAVAVYKAEADETVEAETSNTLRTAGEIAETPTAENAVSNSEELTSLSDPVAERSPSEQASPERASPEQLPEFVFDTSPSGGSFYFWLSAWVIVYLGGMLFIFKNDISSKRGFKWLKNFDIDEAFDSNSQTWMAEPQGAVAQLAYQPIHETTPQSVHKSDQEGQHDSSLPFSRQPERSSESSQQSLGDDKTVAMPSKQTLLSALFGKAMTYESSKPYSHELTPAWADEGVIEPISGLFNDLPHPLGTSSSERKRSKTVYPPHSKPSMPTRPAQRKSTPMTLIATLPAEDPEAGAYTYALLDNAQGYFVLQGNELKVYNETLAKIPTDVDHSITLRRTAADGSQVDKSFVVSFSKTDDSGGNPQEMAPA
jgi:peptidoglycan hydrolase-like protein with peptidoglycan-binding domain